MFNYRFSMFNVFFTLIFIIVIICFITVFIMISRSMHAERKNKKSPVLTVPASVVTKRTAVSHYSHANAGDISGAGGFNTSSATRYFATFEVESGDRMELSISGDGYGMLAEGDIGMLTFRGTDFLSFDRQ